MVGYAGTYFVYKRVAYIYAVLYSVYTMIVYLKVVGTCIGTLLRVTRGKRLQMYTYLHTLSLCRRGGGGKKVGQTAKRTIEHCETISRHAMVGSGGPGYTSEFLP